MHIQLNKSAHKAYTLATNSTYRKELEVSFVGARTDPEWSCNRTETVLGTCNEDVTKRMESKVKRSHEWSVTET